MSYSEWLVNKIIYGVDPAVYKSRVSNPLRVGLLGTSLDQMNNYIDSTGISASSTGWFNWAQVLSDAVLYAPMWSEFSSVTDATGISGNVITPNTGTALPVTNGTPVVFTATAGTFPSGIVANTIYYVVGYNSSTGAFSIAATPGGTAITLGTNNVSLSVLVYHDGWDPNISNNGIGSRGFYGYNAGVNGQTTAQISSRKDYFINTYKADLIVIDAGTNDIGTLTKEAIQSARESLATYYLSKGKMVVLLPIQMRGYDPSTKTIASIASNTITSNVWIGVANGYTITFAGTTLPTGISAHTTYYVYNTNSVAKTFQLVTTPGDSSTLVTLGTTFTNVTIYLWPANWGPNDAGRKNAEWCNERTKTFCRNNPNMYFFDWNEPWINWTDATFAQFGIPYSNYTIDGTHFDTLGAYAVGKKFASFIMSILDYRQPVAWTSSALFNATDNPFGNIFTNPAFIGTGGTITSGTGSVPTGVTVTGNANVITVASVVLSTALPIPQTNIVCNYLKLSFTPTAGTSNAILVTTGPIAHGLTLGSWYQASVKVQCDAQSSSTPVILNVALRVRDQGSANKQSWVMNSPSAATQTMPTEAWSGTYVTPPIKATGVNTQIYVVITTSGAASNSNLYLGMLTIKQVDNPITDTSYS